MANFTFFKNLRGNIHTLGRISLYRCAHPINYVGRFLNEKNRVYHLSVYFNFYY